MHSLSQMGTLSAKHLPCRRLVGPPHLPSDLLSDIGMVFGVPPSDCAGSFVTQSERLPDGLKEPKSLVSVIANEEMVFDEHCNVIEHLGSCAAVDDEDRFRRDHIEVDREHGRALQCRAPLPDQTATTARAASCSNQ